ncbi:PPC domain-containing protein [Archangium violaceum]|uniref:PPC domain-containing protein n=1 Tax=Archangium violaceum TaxID=83451 RepID=UPI00193C1AF9|nr:PPC domain-containing protein [Archangium violaceum]QRK04947.1 PPC domain-containing protein [Archangium violaceum]
MRRNVMKALLWMLPLPLLSAWVNPPTTPASGNMGTRFPYTRPVAVGGSVQSDCSLTPGYDAYTLQVPAGSQLKLELTHLGSSMYLDTGLFLYGPRDATGSHGSAVEAQDDDSGYGELSKVNVVSLTKGGEYLVVVGWGNAAGKQYRLQVDCVGGACLSQAYPTPSGYALSLEEQRITPQLQARLDAANSAYENIYSYLRRLDFAWPYATEPSLDRAAEAVLAQGLYEGYRSDTAPVVLTYEQFKSSMYSVYQPLHADILATYGQSGENVQVKRYFREFSTGPNGDNWRTLHIILFPRSGKVIVYEQTAHEI